AVLKRSLTAGRADRETELVFGPFKMDLKKREVFVNGQRITLTAAEIHVLEQLMRHPGEVMSRAKLTELALNRPIEAYDRSIDTLVSKLRRKISEAGIAGTCIRGLRGHGYVLDEYEAGSD
ncbi:MAG: response regulator transcription factor, partial [Gammaproteobacteria bacterium]|nr:response regulator transcription factor [Gammaproteobacteria bacterium]